MGRGATIIAHVHTVRWAWRAPKRALLPIQLRQAPHSYGSQPDAPMLCGQSPSTENTTRSGTLPMSVLAPHTSSTASSAGGGNHTRHHRGSRIHHAQGNRPSDSSTHERCVQFHRSCSTSSKCLARQNSVTLGAISRVRLELTGGHARSTQVQHLDRGLGRLRSDRRRCRSPGNRRRRVRVRAVRDVGVKRVRYIIKVHVAVAVAGARHA